MKQNYENINKFNKQNLYKQICYVSQDEMLLNESIDDYLKIITHRNIADDSIQQVKAYCRLNKEVKVIKDNGTTLSGGEKKKILNCTYKSHNNGLQIIGHRLKVTSLDETPYREFSQIMCGMVGQAMFSKNEITFSNFICQKNVFNLKKIKGGQALLTIILKTPAGEFSPYL